MKILVELPEWQYKEIKGTNGISEGVMINALCAIRLGEPLEQEPKNANMVAMLTELRNKLIDKSWNIDMYDDDLDFECCYLNDIDEVIQQKINALKAETEAQNGQTSN